MGKLLLRLALMGLASLPVVGCVALEESLVFHPRPYRPGDWRETDSLHEDAFFATADGVRLHGWFAAPPQPRAVVLYCHGNAGNVASCDWVLDFFRERMNCAVLVFDYRGYGKSGGEPHEDGILLDARAARAWLAQRTGVAEGDIVLVGRSLGGAVAVDLAAKDGAKALVLENTFTSVADMADAKLSPLPARWLVDMRLDSQSLIKKYRGPFLQTHGDADRLVPYELAMRLFDTANYPKLFVKAPGQGHNDMPTMEYVEVLDRFLAGLPAK